MELELCLRHAKILDETQAGGLKNGLQEREGREGRDEVCEGKIVSQRSLDTAASFQPD